jgi:hypothetical protein
MTRLGHAISTALRPSITPNYVHMPPSPRNSPSVPTGRFVIPAVVSLGRCPPLTLPRFARVPPSPRGRGERVGVRGRHWRMNEPW